MSQERVSHRFTIRPQPLVLAILSAGWLLAALLPAAQATPFTVNSTLDAVDANPGDGVCATATNVCTLRAAIQEANALAGADTITLPTGMYTLSIPGPLEDEAATGDLDITEDLTLTGAGTTIIDGGGLDRVFDIVVVDVQTIPEVTIAGVTIENGQADGVAGPGAPGGDGGGIRNGGTLTVRDSVLSQNTAGDGGDASDVGDGLPGGPGGSGGGIYNSSTLTVSNTTLSHNTTGSGGDGGGRNLSLGPGGPGGSGGGIFNSGTLTVSDSTLSQNTAGTGGSGDTFFFGPGGPGGSGGGIFNSGTLTVNNMTLSHNTAGSGGVGGIPAGADAGPGGPGGDGGGISNSGTLTVRDSTLSQNTAGLGGSGSGGPGGHGGGIFNSDTLTVTASTLNLNAAGTGGSGHSGGPGGHGGGILNSGILMGTNTTLSQNTSGNSGVGAGGGGGPGLGGGIYNSGTLTMTNSTFSLNNSLYYGLGGSIFNADTATLCNTIFAHGPGTNCYGPLSDDGYNLSSDPYCAFTAPTSRNKTDPLLLPLQDNGGPTDTHTLCTDEGLPDPSCPGPSPALDVIPPGLNGCGTTVATDQRGVLRPQGPGCDMGAVEATTALLPFAALRAQVTLSRTPLSKLSPNTDSFSAQGAFTLDPASNGIAPPSEVVRFTLADRDGPFFTQTFLRGSFRPFGSGGYFFRAPAGQKGIQSLVLQGGASTGHFSFSVKGAKLDLRGANHPPVTVGLQIGGDTGARTLGCQRFKQGWRCQ